MRKSSDLKGGKGSGIRRARSEATLDIRHPSPLTELALAADDDPVAQAFVLRKSSLNEEQFNKFLTHRLGGAYGYYSGPNSIDGSHPGSHAGASFTNGGSAVHHVHHHHSLLTRKVSAWDVGAKSGDVALQMGERGRGRMRTSICCLPLVSPLSRLYMVWSSWILILDMTYTAFLVPIFVAFEVSDVDWGWGCIIDFTAGLFYMLDLVFNFHVGFVGKYNTQKTLVMDGRAIAHYYIRKGTSVVDFITACCWAAQVVLIILVWQHDVALNSPVITSYQIIRIVRLVRFVTLLNRLYATAMAASAIILPGVTLSHTHAHFFNLLFGGAMLLNFLSCLWNYVAIREGLNNTWVNAYNVFIHDYAADPTQAQLTQAEALTIPPAHRWLAGTYYMLVTILTVGYGDISPRTKLETAIAMICMVLGIVFFGILLGSIAEALQHMSKESQRVARYRARMENVDKWMAKRRLPVKLRSRISHYYAEEWVAHVEGDEEVQIMEELPHTLRREIALAVNRGVFQRLQLFHDFPERQLRAIANMMLPIKCPAGIDICVAGDVVDCIWVLHEGEVVEVDADGLENEQGIKAPAVLGETALLQEQDETYVLMQRSFRTRSSSLLWQLPMRDLLGLLRKNPDLYRSACRQAVPTAHFDYLAIVNKLGGNGELQAATAAMRPGLLQAKASSLAAGSPGPSGAEVDGGLAVLASPFAAVSGAPQLRSSTSTSAAAARGARHMSQSQARFSSSKSSRRLQP